MHVYMSMYMYMYMYYIYRHDTRISSEQDCADAHPGKYISLSCSPPVKIRSTIEF